MIDDRPYIRNLHLCGLLMFFMFISTHLVVAQSYAISGVLQGTEEGHIFPAATVVLMHPKDSSVIKGVVTDLEGSFVFENIPSGKYIIKAQYIGFQTILRSIAVNRQDLYLDNLVMEETASWLDEITVEARHSTGVLLGDTSQYNASAFKTMQDASAQSLVEKLPGVNIENGNLQAEGEDIVQILVDGKPFFGKDVKAALQNLPAEVIESIQIYDKPSDKAELSGFDDGEQEKTINIITKPNRRSGQFGKMSAGYGSNNRYLLGTSVNFFNEDQRVTVTGLTNNINALGYSADANSQGRSRPQNGIIHTQMIGLNFSDDWGDKAEISGSYQFSERENDGQSLRIRDYVLPSSEGQLYRQSSSNVQNNRDHRFNMRFDYRPNKNNRLIFRPNASIKNDQSESQFLGSTTASNRPVNQTTNNRQADNDDYDIGGSLFFSHRFPKKGRSLTVGGNSGYHTNHDEANRIAENQFFGEEVRTEALNQFTDRDRTGYHWEADISYTEPIGKKGQVALEYEIRNNWNDSDLITYDVLDQIDPTEVNLLPDTALSNVFRSDYLAQDLEIGYQYKVKKLRIQLKAEYRRADLINQQEFPQPFDIERTFENWAPTLRIDFKFSKNKRLDLDYDTYIRTPNINQLQDVIDISNPLRLRTGNPALDQAFTNRIRARFRNRNPETDQSFFIYLSSSSTNNYITNRSIIAEAPILLEEGITLEEGSQLTFPINLDGHWNVRSYFSYGQPLDFLKSNGHIFGSVNYSRRPGLINEQLNFANNTNWRVGASISSNISDQIDFRLSTRSGFNTAENSLQPSLNNHFFSQSTHLTYDWIIWNGLVYRLDLNHRFNNGLAADLDNSFLLLKYEYWHKNPQT